MGLEKAGLKLINAWAKTSERSLLATKPVKVNIEGLKLAPQLEGDVVQFSKQANRWTKNPTEYVPDISIPNSHIPSHGAVESYNRCVRGSINRLRNGTADDIDLVRGYQIIKTDKEFAKLTPLEKDCIAYRGIALQKGKTVLPFDIVENANVGDIVKLDEGYSYAFQHEEALFDSVFSPIHPGRMFQVIRIPKGARVSRGGFQNEASMNVAHGSEFLMPRGAEYRLISKEPYIRGSQKVVLEYIIPDSKYPKDIEQIKKVALQHINSTDEVDQKYAQKILNEIKDLEL